MVHCVQLIVAPADTARRLVARLPDLPRLRRDDGVDLLPVDRSLVRERFGLDANPPEDDETFMLLNDAFREGLREMSDGGLLAYVETEYSGSGGQGAAVFRDGVETMAPAWRERNVVNEALALLGVECGDAVDAFDAIGLGAVRGNDDVLALIEAKRTGTGARARWGTRADRGERR